MNRPEIVKERPNGLIAEFRGTKPPAPSWFEQAIAAAPERSFVDVDGAQIQTLSWGERGKPGLLFLHGNGAHADWWSYIAPHFARDYRVVAFSFGGMGQSGWREHYSVQQNVAEALAVMKASGLRDSEIAPVLVGHSFGSIIGSAVAAHDDANLRAAVLMDGPNPTSVINNIRAAYVPRARKIYSTIEEAVMRFRFVPEQPCNNPYIIDWIARTSLSKVSNPDSNDGWCWSSDPSFWKDFGGGAVEETLQARKYPMAVIGAERSRFANNNYAERWRPYLQPNAPVIVIPDSNHHIMVDQPLALVAALRMLFASWPPVAG